MMDFIAHIFWSLIIFAGPQYLWAVIFGTLPDFIPFGLNMIIGPFQNRKVSPNEKGVSGRSKEGMIQYYNRPENLWVYRLYNWTHSIVVWGVCFVIGSFIGLHYYGVFPYSMFAWLLHILIDIPTHEKAFFAAQFLTPFSHYSYDGKSWARPRFMTINYLLIAIFFTWRLLQYT